MEFQLELFVKKIEASVAFYLQLLPFSILRREADYVELQYGNITLAFCSFSGLSAGHYLRKHSEVLGSRMELRFQVENIEQVYHQTQERNIKIYEPLRQRPWGKTDFRVTDPDGAYIRITSPLM